MSSTSDASENHEEPIVDDGDVVVVTMMTNCL